jgi:hypothetical protein
MSEAVECFNWFTSPYRRCGDCGRLRTKGHYSICSKCKVFVYCNKECQANHWKADHKSTCKPQTAAVPHRPTYPAFDLVHDGKSTLEDLDRPYQFIALAPHSNKHVKPSKEDWQNTVQGVQDPSVCSALAERFLTSKTRKISKAATATLQQAFGWNEIAGSCPPGYSARFNGYALRGIYDDGFQSRPDLGQNVNAAYIYHADAATWNGPLVLCCTADTADMAAAASGSEPPSADMAHPMENERAVCLTRRQVLDMIEYHVLCGTEHQAVPDCVRHENISRAAALKMFKNEKYHVL